MTPWVIIVPVVGIVLVLFSGAGFSGTGNVVGRTVPVSRGSARTARPAVPSRFPLNCHGVALVGLSLLLAGCGNMKKQRYARPDSPAAPLPRGTSAQLPPPHVVAYGAGARSGAKAGARGVPEVPVKVTIQLLERGRERFTIYCAVCHGPDGYGRGIVVRRGFPAPPSFHDERLRNVPTGYFFQVMTNGHGLMYSYADRVAPVDRWAIAAYIRALQLSQHADVQRVSTNDRQRLPQR